MKEMLDEMKDGDYVTLRWVADSTAPDNGGDNIRPRVIQPKGREVGRFIEVMPKILKD